MTIPTPTYTPVTAAAVDVDNQWPTFGLDTPTGTGVQSALSLPLLQLESTEPLQAEDGAYLMMEGA